MKTQEAPLVYSTAPATAEFFLFSSPWYRFVLLGHEGMDGRMQGLILHNDPLTSCARCETTLDYLVVEELTPRFGRRIRPVEGPEAEAELARWGSRLAEKKRPTCDCQKGRR